MLPPSAIAGVSLVCALGPWVFSEAVVLRSLAAVAAATAITGAFVMRRWDTQASRRVAELTRARASDEWRHEERVAELEADLEESRELRARLEQRLRAKRTELRGLRNEHAALLRRYATAETERAGALEGRRLLEIGAASPARALAAGRPVAGPQASGGAAAGAPDAVEPAAAGTEPVRAADGGPQVPRVFSPEGSRLFRRAGAALSRLAGEAAQDGGGDGRGDGDGFGDGAAGDGGGGGVAGDGGDGGDIGNRGVGGVRSVTADQGGPSGAGDVRGAGGVEDSGDAGAGSNVTAGGVGGTGASAAGPGVGSRPGGTEAVAEPGDGDTAAGAPQAPAADATHRTTGQFAVPPAAAVVPPAPARRPVTEGGFDFFGTKSPKPRTAARAASAGTASPSALEAVQNEDLADIVGQEALAAHQAATGAEAEPDGAEPSRQDPQSQVIDLTAHDETEQIDVQGLRSAAS